MTWIKSSACKADQPMCVEVERCHAGELHLRSSRDPGQYIHVTNDEFAAFVAGAKNGDFDDVQ